jgi:hypothetical protein
MTMLALALPSIAVVSFDLRCATPVLPVAIGRPGSSPPRSLPKQAFNVPRQQTASVEIPIASDAPPRHTSRGFLNWRFAYAGPGARRSTFMGPASENLHKLGSRSASTLLLLCPNKRTSRDAVIEYVWCLTRHMAMILERTQGRASRIMLTGVSAARRTRLKPPALITSASFACPAWAPSAIPTSCDSDTGTQAMVENA